MRDVLVDLRLAESKLTMGLSGGRSELPMSERRKYACHHEPLDEPSPGTVH
ncbi:hypothetical protein BH24PSE2_BH24PSE2_15340 [soil metagenome]